MSTLLRRIRGALGTALVWGIAWGIVGIVPGVLLTLLAGPADASLLLASMALFAASGFISGGIFSLILATVYRRRGLRDLRPKRVGALGMAGAMVLALAGVPWVASNPNGADTPADEVLLLLVAGGLGWASAAGAVRIAQSSGGSLDAGAGGPRDRSALGAGADPTW